MKDCTVIDKSIRRLVRVAADVCELKYRLEILLTYSLAIAI